MSHIAKIALAASVLGFAIAPFTSAQAQPAPYGAPLNLATAKKAMAAAEAEATKNNWPVAIAVIDTTGSLVMFQKIDNTQTASVEIALGKARTALDFKRPSKALEDAIAGGGAGLRVLSLRNASPLEGGVPVIVDGKIVGAVGVSGVLSGQDAQVAKAGADAAAK